jgi:2-polyprenyl-3-methyl-5-hydroxy-6-metoxy-1,4-benzoquinol methylase
MISGEQPISYMIPVGESDRERLDALGAIFNPTSIGWVRSKCTQDSNKKFLDVGCGNGGLTCLFAQTFKNSEFLGVDISSKQIDVCTERAKKEGLNNISWEVCDVYHMEDLKTRYPQLFDIVHSRFVLSHLEKLKEPVDQLLSMLKPGGLLLIEESGNKREIKKSCKAIQAWEKMVHLQHTLQKSHQNTIQKISEYLTLSPQVSFFTLQEFDVQITGQTQKKMFRIGAEYAIKKINEMGMPELIKQFGYENSQNWLEDLKNFETDDSIVLEMTGNESIVAEKNRL